jgi:hypothetical protein
VVVGLLALIALLGCGWEGRTHRAGSRSARTARIDVDHELEIAHDACPLKDRLHKEIPDWPRDPRTADAAEAPVPDAVPAFSAFEIVLGASVERPFSPLYPISAARAPPLS